MEYQIAQVSALLFGYYLFIEDKIIDKDNSKLDRNFDWRYFSMENNGRRKREEVC